MQYDGGIGSLRRAMMELARWNLVAIYVAVESAINFGIGFDDGLFGPPPLEPMLNAYSACGVIHHICLTIVYAFRPADYSQTVSFPN